MLLTPLLHRSPCPGIPQKEKKTQSPPYPPPTFSDLQHPIPHPSVEVLPREIRRAPALATRPSPETQGLGMEDGGHGFLPTTVSLVPGPKNCSYEHGEAAPHANPSAPPPLPSPRSQPGSGAAQGTRCPDRERPCAAVAHPDPPPSPAATHPARSAGCRPQKSGLRLQCTAPALPTKTRPAPLT